jgi:hypothetical protein
LEHEVGTDERVEGGRAARPERRVGLAVGIVAGDVGVVVDADAVAPALRAEPLTMIEPSGSTTTFWASLFAAPTSVTTRAVDMPPRPESRCLDTSRGQPRHGSASTWHEVGATGASEIGPEWVRAGIHADDTEVMSNESRMVFLGFGKFARADKIYALEPLRGDERGDGKRTRVWVEGLTSPIIASRTERTILHDMGQDVAADAPIVAEALDLAERLAVAAEAGRVDLGDLGRRARRLLASTTTSPDDTD